MKVKSERLNAFVNGLKHAFAIDDDRDFSAEDVALIRKLAELINRRGMAAPAIMFLESARPLNYIGSQLMVFFQPIVTVFFSPPEYERLARILERRGSIDALIEAIETVGVGKRKDVRE